MVGGYLWLEQPRFAGDCMWCLKLKESYILGVVGIFWEGAGCGATGCVGVDVCHRLLLVAGGCGAMSCVAVAVWYRILVGACHGCSHEWCGRLGCVGVALFRRVLLGLCPVCGRCRCVYLEVLLLV